MTNRREQRLKGFWLLRQQLEPLSSEVLKERLQMGRFNRGATVARQILRERGEPEGADTE